MNILIVGTGYVGLVTGACLAEMGHSVLCLDIDENKVQDLENGIIPFYEPGLEELVKRNCAAKRLAFTTNYQKGVSASQVCFLAVPTPSQEDGSCDLSYVLQAAKEIGKHMTGYRLIVNKSTVPVGTAAIVKQTLLQSLVNEIPFDVVSNPEFLKEGSAVADCMKPDRIIIGVDSLKAEQILKEIYAPFTLNRDRILTMDIPSAEMTKYAANAMLATRISFMNEMASLCEKVGANINDVRIGIGSDQRIGTHFLYAGIGYGGSCFPKDIRALKALAQEKGVSTPILQAVDSVNEMQKRVLLKKISSYFKGALEGKTIAIWGLSFKPDTDDIREAPSLKLIEELLACGAHLRLYDPVSMKKALRHLPNTSQIRWCENEYEAAQHADAVALVTEWKQFRFVDLEEILKKMQGKAFFDGRNQYKPHEMRTRGFDYFGIGLPH